MLTITIKKMVQFGYSDEIILVLPHGHTPKTGANPNDHTDKVTCQSCHIPEFARVNPINWFTLKTLT
jgi:hypothetical protein